MKKFVLDIAFLKKDLDKTIKLDSNYHTLQLDTIRIDESTFKHIFYQSDNFGIQNNEEINKYITLCTPWRTVGDRGFSLLDTIMTNLEEDLNVTRNCFTTESSIELAKELSNIKTLCDIPLYNAVTLTWSQIIHRIREKYINTSDENKFDNVDLNITIVFKVKMEDTLETHVKFTYNIDVNEEWIINITS
jgi:hypothetical protein